MGFRSRGPARLLRSRRWGGRRRRRVHLAGAGVELSGTVDLSRAAGIELAGSIAANRVCSHLAGSARLQCLLFQARVVNKLPVIVVVLTGKFLDRLQLADAETPIIGPMPGWVPV